METNENVETQTTTETAEAPTQPKFPGTEATLARLNKEFEAKKLAAEEARKAAAIKEEKRARARLAQTKEGRIELARITAKEMRDREAAKHAANVAAGKAASDLKLKNKQKRAAEREAAVQLAQAKKSEQANQGRK